VRVVNPGHLVSNAAPLALVDSLGLRGVTPAGVRQDGAPVDLVVIGSGLLSGATVRLTPAGGAPRELPTTWIGAGEVHVVGLVPGTLAVGQYDLTVANPDGAVSTALKFTVMEAPPVLAAVSPACMPLNQLTIGTVTGSNLYPSSVVRVSGNSIVDSPLATTCDAGTDALGRCGNGTLRVTVDLTGIAAGTYTVSVVNPGSPSPLRSGTQAVQVKAGCP
jgi:hypothetical protein